MTAGWQNLATWIVTKPNKINCDYLKTQIVTKSKSWQHSNSDKTQNDKLLQNLRTTTKNQNKKCDKIKNSNCDITEIATKLKNTKNIIRLKN